MNQRDGVDGLAAYFPAFLRFSLSKGRRFSWPCWWSILHIYYYIYCDIFIRLQMIFMNQNQISLICIYTVCKYIYIYDYIYIWLYIYIWIYIYIYIFIYHIYTYKYIYIYVHNVLCISNLINMGVVLTWGLPGLLAFSARAWRRQGFPCQLRAAFGPYGPSK